MTTAVGHRVGWVTPPPLWDRALEADAPVAMREPLLLSMSGDDFMDRLKDLLLTTPAQLETHQAVPESFRVPLPGANPAPSPPDLKLYQPLHGRFPLVMAAIVCPRPGLPAHQVIPDDDHRVGFALRRMTGAGEEAWAGPAEDERGWVPVTPGDEDRLVGDEEMLPMFPMRCAHGDGHRTLWAGLVPTGVSQQAVPPRVPAAAAPRAPSPSSRDTDIRVMRLRQTVLRPLEALASGAITGEGLLEASRFLLLDLADVLGRFVPDQWAAVLGNAPAPGSLAWHLEGRVMTNRSWAWLLRAAWGERAGITGESATPPAVDVSLGRSGRFAGLPPDGLSTALADEATWLEDRVVEALPPSTAADSAQAVVSDMKYDPLSRDRFVVRCVYRRPACGVLGRAGEWEDVVSGPSRMFAIAPALDPDAPARPIRISLPIDTSVRGLRGFRKNVSILIGPHLQRQMNQVTDIKKALDGEMAAGKGLDIGLICSLSIPLITICALVVLMIFLVLLNLVFFWLPFFRICLPAPRGAAGE